MSRITKVVRMKVVELVLDFNLYPRQKVDPYHVNEMIESLKAGSIFPAVLADSKSKRVVDGFHRCAALQRVYKEKAEVDVKLKSYASEAEMYKEAMQLNSAHGRNLTSYDKAHCILRGRELGLDDESIARALRMTTDRVANLIGERWTADQHVVKATMGHLAGETLTQEQREFIPKAGGMDQLFYINQVVALVETNSIDWKRERVVNTLKRLHGALGKALEVKV